MTEIIRSTHRWLEIATDYLCKEAKEHLRVEIEAKYQAALVEARAAGAAPSAAERSAMAALGDALKARKEYRKRYLWQQEVEYLRWMRGGRFSSNTLWRVWLYAMPIYLTFLVGSSNVACFRQLSVLVYTALFAFPVTKYGITPWLWRRGKIAHAVTTAQLPWLMLILAYLGHCLADYSIFSGFALIFAGGIILLFTLFFFLRSLKCNKFDERLNRRWAGVYYGPGDDDVETWIEAATDGLCDDARKRLAEEIQMHYQDAVADLTAEGMDTAAAHRTALEDLGNPYQARAAYRRSYLTSGQDRYLRMLDGIRAGQTPAAVIFILAMGSPLLLAAFIGIPLGSAPGHGWENLRGFLSVIAPPLFFYGGLYWANRRAFLRAPLHTALLSHLSIVLLGLTPPLYVLLSFVLIASTDSEGMQILLMAGPILLVFFYFLGNLIFTLVQLAIKTGRGNASIIPPDTPMAGE